MNLRLRHRRPARPAAPCKPPTGCTCVIRHAVTNAERDKVLDDICRAMWDGETLLVVHLEERLRTSRNCPALRGRWM